MYTQIMESLKAYLILLTLLKWHWHVFLGGKTDFWTSSLGKVCLLTNDSTILQLSNASSVASNWIGWRLTCFLPIFQEYATVECFAKSRILDYRHVLAIISFNKRLKVSGKECRLCSTERIAEKKDEYKSSKELWHDILIIEEKI